MILMKMILLTFCFYLTLKLNHISGQLNEHTNVQQNQTISHIVFDANETNPIAKNNQSEMDVMNLVQNQLNSSLTNEIPMPNLSVTTSNDHMYDQNVNESNVKYGGEEQETKSDTDNEKKRKSQQTQLIIDFSGTNEKRLALQRQISEGDDRKSSIVQNQEQRAISKTERNISEFQVEQQQKIIQTEKQDDQKCRKENEVTKIDEKTKKEEKIDKKPIHTNNETILNITQSTKKNSESPNTNLVTDVIQPTTERYRDNSQNKWNKTKIKTTTITTKNTTTTITTTNTDSKLNYPERTQTSSETTKSKPHEELAKFPREKYVENKEEINTTTITRITKTTKTKTIITNINSDNTNNNENYKQHLYRPTTFHGAQRFVPSSTNSLSDSDRYSEDVFYDTLYDSLCLFPALSNFSNDVWKSHCADSDIDYFISHCSFSEIYHAPFYINKVFFLKLLKCCRTLIRNYEDLFNVYSETNHLCYKYFHC
ncbi:unnamed protein product [Schistosoma guineensis]|nr:unnamed protein product [Schistosoma guineensis]